MPKSQGIVIMDLHDVLVLYARQKEGSETGVLSSETVFDMIFDRIKLEGNKISDIKNSIAFKTDNIALT